MSCDKQRPLIEKLADGDCSAEEKLRAEGHLEVCDACRSHLLFLRSLSEAARRTDLPEPPGAYWEALPRKVMARIEEERRAKAIRGRFAGLLLPSRLRWIGAAAVGLLAVVLSLEIVGLRSKAPTPSETMTARESPPTEDSPRMQKQAAEKPASVADEVRRKAEEPVLERKLQKPMRVSEPQQPTSEEPAAGTLANQPERVPAMEARTAVVSDSRFRADYSQPAGRATEESVEPAKPELEGKPAPAAAPPPAAPAAEGGLEVRLAETAGGKAATTTFAGEPPAERGRLPRESARSAPLTQQAETEKDTRSEIELEAECARLRGLLDEDLAPDPAAELNYRLAICSIRLFDGRGTEVARRQALADALAFLEISPQGERADALRREVKRIQDREKREELKR